MTFERPEAWWLLALAAPIVALHLHLRRRTKLDVSSLELWRGLVEGRARRGGLRNVRDAVALAFLLASLAAFAGAAAGPVTGTAASEPRRLAIVIDASATMGATVPTGGTRFVAAGAAADAAAKRLAPQDELCVWLGKATPRVFLEPTRGNAGIDEFALSSFGPTLEPSAIATTTRLAVRAARGLADRAATVLVLTDALGAESLRDVVSKDVDFHVGVVDGDRAARNAGIVAFDVDPTDATRLLVRVATTDGRPVPRTLVLSRDSVEIARAPLLVDVDGNAASAFPLGVVARSGGRCDVHLEPGDDFAADDWAWLMLPASKPLAVAVVAEKPSPFLVEALRAMQDVVDPARTTLVAPGAPASAFDGVDVVVAEGVVPPSGKPSVVFGGEGTRVAEKPLLWSVGRHAILDGVDLSPLRIERAVVLDPAPDDTPIVASSAGAVGVVGERDGVRHVTFGFRPDATTLPLEAAFPLLVRNALRWAASPPAVPRFVVVGEPTPDGDGEIVPYPSPPGTYGLWRSKSGAETQVRWIPPRDFHLSPKAPVAAMSAAEAVAALPDRHADADTRKRHAPTLAAVGAAFLALGALLLRRRNPTTPVSPPAIFSAPPIGAERPTATPAA